MNVLFVDDDSDESYLFNEALEHAGISVTLSNAYNSNDLTLALQKEPKPDIVFLDVNMPYKDGVECLIDLRTAPVNNDLPIVIYTTSKAIATIDKCYTGGADLYIIKPDDFDGMVSVIKEVTSIDWANFKRPSREEFVLNGR